MPRLLLVTVAVLSLGGIAGPIGAHELKVFANRLAIPGGGGKATVFLADGHRVPVDNLIDEEVVERYDLLAPGGAVTPLKKNGVSIHANVVDLQDAGIHTAVASRKPSVWTYVVGSDGERRLRQGSRRDHAGAKIDSAIRYQQHAKTLIVVGEPGAGPPKAVGLPVELIALDGPSRWTANKDIRFQILHNGKPVPIVNVVARYVGFKPDDAWSFATETDRKGEFAIRPDRAGTWIIGVEFRNLATGLARELYDFESYATTLTFEVQP